MERGMPIVSMTTLLQFARSVTSPPLISSIPRSLAVTAAFRGSCVSARGFEWPVSRAVVSAHKHRPQFNTFAPVEDRKLPDCAKRRVTLSEPEA